MGECWNENGFKDCRNKIISINKQVGKTFKHAYHYIGAAKTIHDDWSSYNTQALNLSKLNNLKEELKNKILTNFKVSTMGNSRHLFATAFTPNGIVTYIDSIYRDCKDIYVLNGGPGTGKTSVLTYIYKEALKRGLFVEVYHDALIPEKIEHIVIPALNIAILTSNEINQKKFKGYQINMDNYLNKNMLKNNMEEIKKDIENFYLLLNTGLKIIAKAKSLHDELEKYYIPNMNFDKTEEIGTQTINKILIYEKDFKRKSIF
ncbi:ATPase [Clostridium aestuarii]|uniref:ATPase n=1 Tax=Clostridium aestuarii TaxID=338193 RepID=A0ABT4CZM6_9CLOT|nr:ATPase [Clostridium aestuarii]MCY6483263.1 ATPase [Clostridium aestuarii]